jgi:hypothetical protein
VKLTTHLHLVARSKSEWSYTSTSQYAFMAWCSVKHRDFTFYGCFLPVSAVAVRNGKIFKIVGIIDTLLSEKCKYFTY